MSPVRFNAYVAACMGLVCLGACTTTTRSTALNYSVQHIDHGDRGALVQAALAAIEQTGFQIGHHDPESVRLVSHPLFDVSGDQPAGRTSRISTRARTRRIAELRIDQPGDRLSLYCRVLVQEQTTRAHRMLALDRTGDDSPAATAIDRDAAVTDRQNTVWDTIRRDRLTERRILSLVDEKMRGAAP